MSDFIVYFFSDYAANTYAAQMEAIDMSLILDNGNGFTTKNPHRDRLTVRPFKTGTY